MERNLRAADRAVVSEADFDRQVEQFIVIWMDGEGDSGGQKRGCIEEKIDPRELFKGRQAGWIREGHGLINGDTFDGLAIVGFVSDIGGSKAGIRDTARDGEGGEEPGRLGQKIVEGHSVGDTIRA